MGINVVKSSTLAVTYFPQQEKLLSNSAAGYYGESTELDIKAETKSSYIHKASDLVFNMQT